MYIKRGYSVAQQLHMYPPVVQKSQFFSILGEFLIFKSPYFHSLLCHTLY
jgi:hypothetical protein